MNSGKRQVVLISLITAACLLGDSMLYIVLPLHYSEVGLQSLWEVGVLLSVNRFVRLPLAPLVGWFYKTFRARTGITIAVLLAAVTTFCYGLDYGFPFLLAARCLWGVAWTLLRLGAFYLIIDLSDAGNRGYLMGTYNGLYRLGSLGGMLAGGLLADAYGLPFVATVFAAVSLVALPAAWLSVSEALGESAGREGAPAARALTMRWNATWLKALGTGLLIAMVYQGIFTATLSHLTEEAAGTIPIAGFVLGSAALAGILQAIRWGWEPLLAPWVGKQSDGRWGRDRLLGVSLLAGALLYAALPLPMPLAVWLAVVLGVQLTATVLTTVADTVATDLAAADGKSVMTTYSLATDLGAALGPFLGYTVIEGFSTGTLYLGTAAVLLVMAVLWSPLARGRRVHYRQEQTP
ncbi:MFS transporter [Paenibacillus sp. J31TS4]|uniref:MFS transporter n=1 Tax=Paenibacillus sp. J31TS4 TaxID=2807195 RepID=UPI001B03D1FA|nr:MFS transporter [Paenibacillus sp. J31TS4]GIP40005.1 MFS transporter [Paenibacillus sp. J31TS4]